MKEKIKESGKAFQQNVNHLLNNHPRAYHICENLGHGMYFSFVFAQGHGFYTYIAGVMVIFVFLNLVRDNPHDEE